MSIGALEALFCGTHRRSLSESPACNQFPTVFRHKIPPIPSLAFEVPIFTAAMGSLGKVRIGAKAPEFHCDAVHKGVIEGMIDSPRAPSVGC